MPRRPRLQLPGVPLHVVHRGVNRGAIFVDDHDRRRYCDELGDTLKYGGIQLHAYVLMSNHVHLLLTQPAPGALATAMCRLGRRYVPGFNHRHGRTGTLWEGRFKSCLVDSERYLLAVHRYIELNPVRAAMVAIPQHHRWSSVHASLGLAEDPLVTFHPGYLALGADPATRAKAYRDCLMEPLMQEDHDEIRSHLQQERALGDGRFQAMVEKTLNQPAMVRPRGRPRAQPSGQSDPTDSNAN